MTNSTNFINYETVIYAQWLNDVNNVVYNGNFVSTSLNIGTLTASSASIGSISTASITNGSLTNGQIVYAGAGGLLESSPNLTFNGTQLTVNSLSVTNTLTLNSLSLSTPLGASSGGTGNNSLTGYVYGNGTGAMTASTQIPNTAIGGLGTMSTQNANFVDITGGTMDNVSIGNTTPSSGKFTTLVASSGIQGGSF